MSKNDDDLEIEDLIENLNKKTSKKKNTSKRKGNRGENELADVFCERFPGKKFFRVTGSGARIHQVELNEENKGAFTGDLVCPSDFEFCVECKYGYADYELCGFFNNGHKDVDAWLTKAKKDAESLGKMAMLCWRKPRYEWLAFVPIWTERTYSGGFSACKHNIMLMYKGWMVTTLKKWLELPDEFWFKQAKK